MYLPFEEQIVIHEIRVSEISHYYLIGVKIGLMIM